MGLSPLAVAKIAIASGWSGTDLPVAVAVCFAESGGNPNTHVVTAREDSRGLWQINTLAHPDAGDLYNPDYNGKVAHTLFAQQGWHPWSAHNNGSYLLFMPAAIAAVAAAPAAIAIQNPGLVGQAISDTAKSLPGAGVLDAAKSGLSLAYKAGAWLGDRANWVRVAEVVIGGGLIVSGFAMIARPAADSTVAAVAAGAIGKGL